MEKYCPNCQRMVRPINRAKGISWGLVFFTAIVTCGVVPIFYLLWKLFNGGLGLIFKHGERSVCPICNTKL